MPHKIHNNSAMHIINTLLPVFLIIALGAVLRKTNFLSSEFVASLNRLVYWVGLPCLLFYKIVTATHDYQLASKPFLVVFLATLCCIVVGYVVAFIMRIRPEAVGTFVQGAFRGNLYYIGLAVVIYSFSDAEPATSTRMEHIAIVVVALMIPIYNIISVIVLLASQHKVGRYVPAKIARGVLTNPLFLSCVAGVAYSYIFPPLPLVITRSINAVGQISLPLALVCIGATVVQGRIAGCGIPALATSTVKMVVAPAVGFLAAQMMGLGTNETRIALLLLACPVSVASYVMADQLNGDERLAAAIIVLATILSVIPLSIVLALF